VRRQRQLRDAAERVRRQATTVTTTTVSFEQTSSPESDTTVTSTPTTTATTTDDVTTSNEPITTTPTTTETTATSTTQSQTSTTVTQTSTTSTTETQTSTTIGCVGSLYQGPIMEKKGINTFRIAAAFDVPLEQCLAECTADVNCVGISHGVGGNTYLQSSQWRSFRGTLLILTKSSAS
jgi:hypothetical protein